VSQALGCAVDLQLSFAAHSAEHPDEPISVRIGINAGEPLSEDDDLHGLVVATAARICDQGSAGDITVSNVVRELAVGKGYTFVGLGPVPLRGIPDPVQLYRVEY
jgi:adenylate cyclase